MPRLACRARLRHSPLVQRAHVLLLEKIHPHADEEFEAHGISVQRIDRGVAESEVIEALQAAPGDGPVMVGIRSKTRITEAVFEAVPRLMAVGAFCIGTDQIDLAAARERGVAVFNAPFSNTRSVAELVLAEVVVLSRQIFTRSSAAHQGNWQKSAVGAHEIRGKTLGIVGYGHIGSQVSVLAESFGMNVLFHDIDKKLPLGNAKPAPSLTDLLEQSDFVTLHVPDTELTRGMIGVKELAQMKAGSYLLNLSRGKVVDIPALRDALSRGHVSGAAIDVYPKEPKAEGERFVSELQGMDNVILTPHIGGSTQEAQASIGSEVSVALSRYIETGGTLGCVSLPALEVPPPSGQGIRSRIVNIHRNIPGMLSKITRVIAESDVNIVGQSLATLDDVALLFIDIPVATVDPKAEELESAISGLEHSVRTRLVSL